jgi:hypothetical protein
VTAADTLGGTDAPQGTAGLEGLLNGETLFGDAAPRPGGILARRFVTPPLSVLDRRQGPWQQRKAAWLSLGIQSEIGRGESLTFNPSLATLKDFKTSPGTSVFDPVLCELSYRWWCPTGGQVVDPFAGGSVRGVVAAHLGLHYHGIELRAEQVEANVAQSRVMAQEYGWQAPPQYETGDSTELLPMAPRADLVFTCPPYGDLEVYSDDPADLSTMDYPAFMTAWAGVLADSYSLLRDHRYLVVVVGDFRDKRHAYRGFVAHTIVAAQRAGFVLYNSAVIIDPIGTAAQRASAHFPRGRKLTRNHQELLCFVKGDWKKAAQAAAPHEEAE